MPPFAMTTKDGKIIGFEPDLAQDIADSMGVNLRIKTMHFAELLPAVEGHRVDMAISSITMTPRRNLKVAFVGPYFTSGKAFLTKKKAIASAKKGSDMNNPNTRFVALKGSTSQDFVEAVIPRAKLILAKNYDEAVNMVIQDKVDAMVADYPICVVSVFRYPEAGLVSIVTPLTYEPLGVALNANDTLLLNWLENFINARRDNGDLELLKEKWFGDASWLYQIK
jgi:polar amino acid transport system substrate-binding protein